MSSSGWPMRMDRCWDCKGIGTLLTRTGLAQARASGYRFCETDWRSTNLVSSRFWLKQGFRPVAYRLVRRIDPRIAWPK
jgi:ribosomal protein S18 acetylase RimI-like enzyme